ncbi:bifunctional pantoate--beta-alanine ligase/(d)CMP kinase [Coleofasciculus sp. E1-EBD-02]|uniref:bifunctional pantoate--beta-alanine ligase/(d)CMP kinase n=1 Tax=Coleofasciculus sp. E1-EBD-02 TaxID=3068481 RepID=UPI0032FED59C
MRLFTTIAGLRCHLERHRTQKTVGLVPTMGALHPGHLSLIERARRENAIVVVSIFVNPLQFGPGEDLQQYPRQLEEDQRFCEQAGVDVIFAPTAVELYGDDPSDSGTPTEFTQVMPPPAMTSILCGHSRPGHFQGVATVVTKLLNLVQPDRAYFGQKDAQQLAIIRRLVADLNLPVTIVSCPIAREPSGLAYSSRNQYLTSAQKAQAPILYKGLQNAQNVFQAGERDRTALIAAVTSELSLIEEIQVEYIELVHPTTLTPLEQVEDQGLLAIAARLGSTRLIDNILLRNRQPIIAIDGPAGAGKSTVTRLVAQQLGLMYLDTGAMYRAVTWRVLQAEIDFTDEPAIAELVSQCQISLISSGSQPQSLRVWIDGKEVTQAIRSLDVTANVSAIAALPVVRHELVKQQQRWASKGGVVAEGRDIGTHVFPDAELKIFLTASVQERARRRLQDLQDEDQGTVSLEQLEADIQLRDQRDSTRTLAPLRQAADAIEINTDGLTIPEVTDRIISAYHKKALSPTNA